MKLTKNILLYILVGADKIYTEKEFKIEIKTFANYVKDLPSYEEYLKLLEQLFLGYRKTYKGSMLLTMWLKRQREDDKYTIKDFTEKLKELNLYQENDGFNSKI